MSNKIEIDSEKNRVISKFTTGNKQWLAKILGLHDKYEFKREFLNRTRSGESRDSISQGDILEHVRYSHSGKSRQNYYYIIEKNEKGELEKVSYKKSEIKDMLEDQDEKEELKRKVLSKIDGVSEKKLKEILNILED